jgi:hypothetical protein
VIVAKLNFENYRGNELVVGYYGPRIEAEKGETFSQYLQERIFTSSL